MIIDLLKDAILQNLGPTKPAPKGWHRRNCPLCHTQGHGADRRQRFGIQFNQDSIAINCFNCGFHAGYKEKESLSKSFKFFLRQISVDDKFIQHIDFELFKTRHQIEEVRVGDKEKPVKIVDKFQQIFSKWKPADLPADALPIKVWLEAGLDDPEFMSVVEYALSRRIYNLDKFYWSPRREFNLNQRLIIPYYYKKKTVGFTARLYYTVPDKSIPKYYQQCPPDFVYNLDAQIDSDRQYVIVNEGVLDAWSVDGVGVLGEITQSKIDLINRIQKQIIVCPDRDAKGADLVKAAIENNWAVAFPKWDKDIKDAAAAAERYGRLLTTFSIVDSAIKNKDKIKITWDIMINERK